MRRIFTLTRRWLGAQLMIQFLSKRFSFTVALIAVLLASASPCPTANSIEKKYCVAELPTPALNTRDFASVFGGKNGKTVKLDKSGLIREMEFIAFPGTVFEILAVHPQKGHDILEVTTAEYPSSKSIYIDSRFVKYSDTPPPARTKSLPPAPDILKAMASMEGKPYMWGGNVCRGIKEMTEFYKPRGEVDNATRSLWRLEGVDCSGLLYQAADGFTPRNTSSLVNYGRGLKISGLTADEISRRLKPLDLIVWSGHVVIVLESSRVIESAGSVGVKISPLKEKLASVMSDRKPVSDWDSTSGKRFVIRRWFPQVRQTVPAS